MSGYILKPAGTDIDVPVEWRSKGLAPGERVLEDLGWRITPCPAPDDLRVREQHLANDVSFALICAGIPGKTYMVSASVRTDRGRDLTCALVIRIADSEPMAA